MKNLKEAKNCQIAGGAKKVTGIPPELMEKICKEIKGEAITKVLRVVKNGQVFYSKEYTRMAKRNADMLYCLFLVKLERFSFLFGVELLELHWQSSERFSQILTSHSSLVKLGIIC